MTPQDPKSPAKADAKPEALAPKVAESLKAEEEPKEELVREGKPELETPETGPKVVAEETPRDEQTPLETREEPVVAEVRVDERSVAKAVLEAASARVPRATPRATVPPPVPSEAEELLLHVASNPVNSHAPVWTPRTPNATGGYS